MNFSLQRMSSVGMGETRVPWPTIIFLILVFFGADHDVRFSAKNNAIQWSSAQWLVTQTEQGYLPRRIALVSLGTFSLASLALLRRNRLAAGRTPSYLLALFTLLTLMSVLWADDQTLAFRRAVEFLLLCLGAFAVAERFTLRDLLRLAFIGTLIYLVVGFICEIVLGKFAPVEQGYRFCGTLQPNHEGWNCAFLLLSSVFLAKGAGPRRRLFIMIALIAFSFLILTKSRTSFACVGIALLACWASRGSGWRKIMMAHLAGAVLCLFLLLGGEAVLPVLRSGVLMGREDASTSTLSGRTLMWNASMGYIAERPLSGYGFNSFWTDKHIIAVSSSTGEVVPAAHCDYIELLLGVGIPGLALFVAVLGRAYARYSGAYRATCDGGVGFALATLVFYCLVMTTEVIGFSACLPTFIVLALLFKEPRSFAACARG